jgi:hypothetical protein
MLEKYILMCKDIKVGDFIYNTMEKNFTFNKYDDIKDRKYLPLGMYSYKNWNIEYKPTNEDIIFWFEDRVVPKERANIDDILKVMGLIDYDAWELCRRTRAMCMEDYFWLSKGERYENVHIRYLSEHGRLHETPIPFYAEPYPLDFKIIGNKIVATGN